MTSEELQRLKLQAKIDAIRAALTVISDSGRDVEQAIYRVEAMLKVQESKLRMVGYIG
jgi:hypothetical protein